MAQIIFSFNYSFYWQLGKLILVFVFYTHIESSAAVFVTHWWLLKGEAITILFATRFSASFAKWGSKSYMLNFFSYSHSIFLNSEVNIYGKPLQRLILISEYMLQSMEFTLQVI